MATWQRCTHKGQPRRKYTRFTEDRKYVGRWLLSEHREHHPPLGVTNSAGAKDSSQEPTVDARIVIKLPIITRGELNLACYGHAGFSR
ncbi:uncharacterized protein N7518_003933 [Penicillium psychrosexuale]|uniref:uncharacterized protein n=1 Tax=Penicillium psychrosexuale TaxID=1002107 RepID=UPI0025456430|nr:uncharacterized protein N7518_003933 [Penicillium psychrosexuale]KAJ5795393.1 hypothetical protein N7518_003933 [Penicillium psychrosexuale]